MLGNPGTYANKKRKKPVLKPKRVSEGDEVVKSNPSKRHRDRLNGELDRLTDLLPFSEDGRSRLDKLSVLRLSVGYLKVKSYFKAIMMNSSSTLKLPGLSWQNGSSVDTSGFSEGELLLQALNGFVTVITSEGLVFYTSPTIKEYLGFHQSDVVHQSIFNLIHTDDREMFRQQLHFALNPPPLSQAESGLQRFGPEHLPPENSSILERSFVCRLRCLLDNSSGFLALKFQGRLKYLHGQSSVRDNRKCDPPQLALFTIAMPVQAPSIVEIRAKTLMFQTKHKLDFTPLGIDSRGKMILGYSETELCMKGSGYQFIHAADMMYCADNHLRMMKTGESGLTVFRLLSKSNSWVWVKANAKLIYKGGRPEFIIVHQKAILNTEGEEYLRQRTLLRPFTLTTGEAILYNTGPTVDVTHFQLNKPLDAARISRDEPPRSLLDCFLRQDDVAYTQTVDPPVPVDHLFTDSGALVTVGNVWQEDGAAAPAAGPAAVKAESKQSVMAVIDNLEQMAQNGEFSAALQDLEVDDGELLEWENALKRLGQEEEHQSSVSSELDSILANDILDYIDRVLFQEQGGNGLDAGRPISLCSNPPAPLGDAALFSHPYAPKNGPCSQHQEPDFSDRTQRLSHQEPFFAAAGPALPPSPHQQLQLQDIFSPSIDLPELVVPAPFQVPVGHMGGEQRNPAQTPSAHFLPDWLGDGHVLQGAVNQLKNTAPGVTDILPPLIPCTQNAPLPFAAACLQGPAPFEAHKVQPWPQSRQQKGPQSSPVQNGPAPEGQAAPDGGAWPRRVTGPNHTLRGGLACGQAASHSSCMFEQHFSSGPAGGDPQPAPVQGSCCFQWSCAEAGASGAAQEHAGVTSEHFQENHRPAQDENLSAELNGIFVAPPHDVAMYLA